jgi:hypothetical protein
VSGIEERLLVTFQEFVEANRDEQRSRRRVLGAIAAALVGVIVLGSLILHQGRTTERIATDAATGAGAASDAAAQLRSVLAPDTCYGLLSRHSSDLRTWDIKRSLFVIARIPPTDPRYPPRPTPPEGLLVPECRPLYLSFLPNLPK